MASIHLQGTLVDTLGEIDVGAIMTFTHLTNTGETIATTKIDLIIPPNGFYSIDVEYGQIRIDYTTRFTERFIATVIVNQDSTATTIPELLNAAVPVTDPVILEMQSILADAVAAADTSEAFADQLTTFDLIGSVAVYAPNTNFRTKGYLTSGDGGAGHWVQNGVTAQPVSQNPIDLDSTLLNDGNGNQWTLIGDNVDLKSLGFVSGDIELYLVAAINGGAASVIINDSVTCSLTQTNAQTILKYINNITVHGFVSFVVGGLEINLTDFIDINNESATKMDVKGVETANISATGFVGVTGSAGNYLVTLNITDTSNVEVGNYLLSNISGLTGTGRFKEIAGCWKITAKTAGTVTFKHTHQQSSFPTMTITAGTMRPLKSVLKWANGSRGLAIYNCDLNTIKDVVIAGSFDISVDATGDGPDDGLLVGDQSNTSETSSTQSRAVFTGSVFLNRVGVVEWPNNGLQCIGGSVATNGFSTCSNGWRGAQAAGCGFVNSKFSSSNGNGASGIEAEAGGTYNAASSISAGNLEQGVFVIGGGRVVFNSGSYAGGNETNGIDARDAGSISSNTSEVGDNTVSDMLANGGFITLENGNFKGEVVSNNGGHIELNGSTDGGANFTVDAASAIKLPSGLYYERDWSLFPVLPVMNNGTYTDDGTVAQFNIANGILSWKIKLDYSALTLDNNTLTVVNFPRTMSGRAGNVQLNIRTTTGMTFLSTDTFQANYNSSSDAVVITDMSGTLSKYNDGKFNAAGIIELSGWYEV